MKQMKWTVTSYKKQKKNTESPKPIYWAHKTLMLSLHHYVELEAFDTEFKYKVEKDQPIIIYEIVGSRALNPDWNTKIIGKHIIAVNMKWVYWKRKTFQGKTW